MPASIVCRFKIDENILRDFFRESPISKRCVYVRDETVKKISRRKGPKFYKLLGLNRFFARVEKLKRIVKGEARESCTLNRARVRGEKSRRPRKRNDAKRMRRQVGTSGGGIGAAIETNPFLPCFFIFLSGGFVWTILRIWCFVVHAYWARVNSIWMSNEVEASCLRVSSCDDLATNVSSKLRHRTLLSASSLNAN